MNFLGKNIRYLRKQNSQSQTELASVIGKGQTTIGNWENGVSEPGVEELLTLSNYFDISVDILLKIDLSLTNWQSGPKREEGLPPVPPEQPEPDDPSSAPPDHKSLDHVLKEIRAIRAEIAQIQSRLHDEAG